MTPLLVLRAAISVVRMMNVKLPFFFGVILLAVMLVLTAQISLANSATWLSSPQGSAWENPNNWTPGGPPNGPSDIARFAHSSGTNVNISTSVEVNSIVFTSDSFSFFIGDDSQLIISGAGIHNNSISQSFTNYGEGSVAAGTTIFNNTSTAGGATITNYGFPPGTTIFNDTSTAGSATITNGGYFPGSQTIFNDTSTAANATITNDGHYSDQAWGATIFNGSSTAASATITNYDSGAQTIFNDTSTADSALIIANGGYYYGSAILFNGASTGRTARVRVFDNGYLDISGHESGVWIGSIYGSGNVFLGANRLTVGTNGNSTAFSGVISNGGQGGSLAKVGSGVLTLQANDCIADTVGLILVSGSIIKLDFTGPPDTIASLVVNGVPQPPGVYGSATSGAPHPLPEFAGPGTVRVGSPHVTTDPATNLAANSATLKGTVNPNGLTTSVHFEYGTTTSYGSSTATQNYNGTTTHNVSANITGLSPNTTYHFRLVGSNIAGTRYGSDRTFTTLSATGAPVVITNPATNVASFSATLNSSVDPHGLTTTIHFQYGTTTSYGLTTASQSKSGNTYQSVSANIGGLSASTTYHFRIVATNSAGTRYGSDRTFTTLSATGAPVVTTNPATNVTISSTTLNGSLDPHGLTTSVYFQYGTTTSYGHNTPIQSQTGNTYRNILASISSLTTHTTYHFRIVATNNAGTRYGSDRTFTTP